MSSCVFFRFKSQKDPSRIVFDGTSISVFELKREIILQSGLGNGNDFELKISSDDDDEEYEDDTALISRSTTVIARRLPAVRPGRGGAARYVSGKMPQNSKNSHRAEPTKTKVVSKGKVTNTPTVLPAQDDTLTEEQKMAAVLKMGADQWEEQQKEMAKATPVHRNGSMRGKTANVPDRAPPSSYVCYRCGEKGHWINVCPTNDDPSFDDRPKIKRTTGIPRSFLRTIDKPTSLNQDGTVEKLKRPAGVMVNAEGDWVVAEPDNASWEKFQAKAKISAAAQAAIDLENKKLQENGLLCPMDTHIFSNPMKTPCCGTTYCQDCITNSLLENDLRCPQCSTENILIDDLAPDIETIAKIKNFDDEKAEAIREKEASPSEQANSSSPKEVESRSASKPSTVVLTPAGNPNISSLSKKRLAETDIQNDRTGPGPEQRSTGVWPPVPSGQWAGAASNGSVQQQNPVVNGNFTMPQGMNTLPFPNTNGYMGLPGSTEQTFWNAMMMMPNGAFAAGMDMNVNNAWAAGYPHQHPNFSNLGYPTGAMPNGNYGQQNPYMQINNNGMGMNQHNRGMGNFSNQQRNTFRASTVNEEDSAYFRMPVNPHRHQARRNVNRPTDYREI